MFKITSNKGFHITFDNGFTVSVQFGGGNYCDNHDMPVMEKVSGSTDAETAVWRGRGGLLPMLYVPGEGWRDTEEGGDTVQGWQSPAQVLELMQWAASQPTAKGGTSDQGADISAVCWNDSVDRFLVTP